MASLKKAVCQVLTVDPAQKRIQVSDTRREPPQILDLGSSSQIHL